jgi:hypothetical protein
VSEVAEVQDTVVFYCYNPSERKPARLTFLFGGIGKTVLPDGTKQMDTGFRSYRAGANGVLVIPATDETALREIRKACKGGASGVTEDIEVFYRFTLPLERKLQRQEKLDAGKDLEIASLKEQLKKQGKKGE